jgi:hypothetical protein
VYCFVLLQRDSLRFYAVRAMQSARLSASRAFGCCILPPASLPKTFEAALKREGCPLAERLQIKFGLQKRD